MRVSRRALFAALRLVLVVTATALICLFWRQNWQTWSPGDRLFLLACVPLSLALLEFGVPLLVLHHFGRHDGDPGKITFDLPLYVVAFTMYGWFGAAMLAYISYLLAPNGASRVGLGDRIWLASARVPFFFLAGVLQHALAPAAQSGGVSGFCAFVFLNLSWIAAFILLWFDGLTSLRTGTSILRLWRVHVPDPLLWSLFLVQIVWGYCSMLVVMRAGIGLGICSFLPLIGFAVALRALHKQRLAVHRLGLAREAVDAMLGSRDPLPHIHSILSSVHSELLKETLQILVPPAIGSAPWQIVASVGPEPQERTLQLRRQAIRKLSDSGKNYAAAYARDEMVGAFAARDTSGTFLGALTVLRPASTSHTLARERLEAAASALGPLLRDFRVIAATQTAATIDPLTGLANRGAIMDLLERTISRVDTGTVCSIAVLDIDHFKSINDRLGHQAGDKCLQRVGALIAANVRRLDRAGRIGGEEFLIIMPSAEPTDAMRISERLRAAIEDSGLVHADGSPVTASVGVATASLRDTGATLFARADRALYEAKALGRNRVIEETAASA